MLPRRVADLIHPRYADEVERRFARLYYERATTTWQNTRWMGVPIWKNPADLWIYQELVHEIRPDLIVETGTAYGGSALYLAMLCDLLDHGRVVTIDTQVFPDRPVHPRIEYVFGSSTGPGIVDALDRTGPVMVILDSDHRAPHVLDELELYAPLVTLGSYLIVEDTNVNGHPVYPDHGPGPFEAIEQWGPERHGFEVDAACERFLHTFNPGGFLRRVRA